MSIMTSPALRWPRRVTPELHFDGGANSNIDLGNLHAAVAKLWFSFRFKLDTAIPTGGSGPDQFIISNEFDITNSFRIYIASWEGRAWIAHI